MPQNASKLKEDWIPIEDSISPVTARKILSDFLVNSVKIEYPKPGTYKDVLEAMPYVSSISLTNKNISEEQAAIASLQQSDPMDFQSISASKLTLSNSFYNNTLRQSQQSFLWSLIWAGVGALFIISTVTLVIVLQPTIATSVIIALLGGTGGIGSSAIAYATLQLYKQASEQAAACHIRLDR